MSFFQQRERAFEAKFSHDQERMFKFRARIAQLAALWAAGKMGLAGDRAQAYARQLVRYDVENGGSADLVAKLSEDMKARGTLVDPREIQDHLMSLLPRVRLELFGEPEAVRDVTGAPLERTLALA